MPTYYFCACYYNYFFIYFGFWQFWSSINPHVKLTATIQLIYVSQKKERERRCPVVENTVKKERKQH